MGTPDRVPLSLLLGGPDYSPGWQDLVQLPAPAAGAGWSYRVSGMYSERLLAAVWFLQTDAVVANRFPQLALVNGDGVDVAQVPASGTIVAGTGITFYLMYDAPAFAASTAGTSPGKLPDLLVPPGWTWKSTATGYDAGDQESAPTLLVQRFPTGLTRPGAPL